MAARALTDLHKIMDNKREQWTSKFPSYQDGKKLRNVFSFFSSLHKFVLLKLFSLHHVLCTCLASTVSGGGGMGDSCHKTESNPKLNVKKKTFTSADSSLSQQQTASLNTAGVVYVPLKHETMHIYIHLSNLTYTFSHLFNVFVFFHQMSIRLISKKHGFLIGFSGSHFKCNFPSGRIHLNTLQRFLEYI